MSVDTAWDPKIVAFCCNWCSYAGADLAGLNRLNYSPSVRIVRVPCSGRVNPQFVLRAFQQGADGVLVAGCHPGDCHYVSGNYHARRRLLVLERFLSYVGIEPQRFRAAWVSGSEGARFAKVIEELTESVRSVGPNRKLRNSQ